MFPKEIFGGLGLTGCDLTENWLDKQKSTVDSSSSSSSSNSAVTEAAANITFCP